MYVCTMYIRKKKLFPSTARRSYSGPTYTKKTWLRPADSLVSQKYKLLDLVFTWWPNLNVKFFQISSLLGGSIGV